VCSGASYPGLNSCALAHGSSSQGKYICYTFLGPRISFVRIGTSIPLLILAHPSVKYIRTYRPIRGAKKTRFVASELGPWKEDIVWAHVSTSPWWSTTYRQWLGALLPKSKFWHPSSQVALPESSVPIHADRSIQEVKNHGQTVASGIRPIPGRYPVGSRIDRTCWPTTLPHQ
jgi:hypothetical protein